MKSISTTRSFWSVKVSFIDITEVEVIWFTIYAVNIWRDLRQKQLLRWKIIEFFSIFRARFFRITERRIYEVE